ncbi:PDT-domain-containing protein [Aulographum hederae CBS 113979]|uniref:PDT-domain-containing protein n=1 Tax=Aulographum hederae CBS 113979 TaxID=1176131 RepID=A0A6G1GLU9_9PEZI|nr:PDT-domain-containing protein [Aulographum hederae CBS 113979]
MVQKPPSSSQQHPLLQRHNSDPNPISDISMSNSTLPVRERNNMSQPTVAYLGPRASYTHQAALQKFPTDEYAFQPQTEIRDVFEAVQSGKAQRGVVPFENSTNGLVAMTGDLLAGRYWYHPLVRVCGDEYVSVRHCLVGRAMPGVPPMTRKDYAEGDQDPAGHRTEFLHVHELYSHPQAWGQCEKFLGKHLSHASRCNESSTAASAYLVSLEDTPGRTLTMAAIANPKAAEEFGLDVLAEDINDVMGNQTRFLVLRKGETKEEADDLEPTTRFQVSIEMQERAQDRFL